MSRDLNFAKQKYNEALERVQDQQLKADLAVLVDRLVSEAKWSGRARDVLDMD